MILFIQPKRHVREKENKLYALVARDDCGRLQMAESTNRIKYLQQTNACKDASTYLLRIRHKADRAGTFRPHPGVAWPAVQLLMCHRPLQNPLNLYLAEIPGMSHHCCWLEEDHSNYYNSYYRMTISMMISMTTSMTILMMMTMISMMTSMMVLTSVATGLILHSSFLSV